MKHVLIVLIAATLLSPCVWAQDSLNVRKLGTLTDHTAWTQAWDVAVQDHYAFVATNGYGLHILDITNRADPQWVGSYVIGDYMSIWALAVSGNYAYVGAENALVVMDISNPAAPDSLGACSGLPDDVNWLAIGGNYAYAAGGQAGLFVIDISNPVAPVLIGSLNTPGSANAVAVSGSRVYIADGTAGLLIIDVTFPPAPAITGTLDTPGNAQSVTVRGDYAFVADGAVGLQIVDVSNPLSPVITGTCDTPGWAADVVVNGDFAYVGCSSSGILQIVNISNLAAPVLAGSVTSEDHFAYALAVDGTTAYLGGAPSGGVEVFDLSDPYAPFHVVYYGMDGWMGQVAVSGNYAYVPNSETGLWIVDVSNPTAPVRVGACNTPGFASQVEVRGGYAYLADNVGGLRIINVSNPAAPVEVGFWPTSYSTFEVAVSGNFAYLAESNTLRIVNITNPAAPTLVGSYTPPGGASRVAVSGDYAYVGSGRVVRVVNVSNPAAPVEVGSYPTSYWINSLTALGRYVYAGLTDYPVGGYLILDISNPAIPTLASQYGSAMVGDAALDNHYAYLAQSGQGLTVLRVNRPQAPQLAGYYNVPGMYPNGIAVAGDRVYMTHENTLEIYEFVQCHGTPVAPDVVVQPSGQSMRLSWEWVTESDAGCVPTVTHMLVFYSPTSNGPFYYHGCATDTTYTHVGVLTHAPGMYYQVVASTAPTPTIMGLQVGGTLTMEEVLARLGERACSLPKRVSPAK